LRPLGGEFAGAATVVAAPALLTLYFAFDAGGFFAGSTGVGAAVVWVAVAVRLVTAESVAQAFTRPLALAGAALGLFTAWALISAAWSDSSSRALIEFDRALMYAGLLVLFGSVRRTPERTAWALRALFGAFLVVGAFALVSRLLPDVLSVRSDIAADRLSYPITYWNGLGILVGLGLILGLHLACSEREPAWVRVAGAAAEPVLATALYLTLSRGAIVATVAGVVVYLLVARPWGALTGLVAVGAACAIAVVAAYGADLLVSPDAGSAAGVDQGKHVAVWVCVAIAAGAGLRAVGLLLDRRLAGVRLSSGTRRGVAAGTVVAVLAGVAVAFAAFGLGGTIHKQYDRFVGGSSVQGGKDPRSRLTDVGNDGRLDHWDVALHAFRRHPLRGTGAGTYGITWARERDITLKVEDAHSLYVEQLSELGVPGLALVAAAILLVLYGFARGVRTPERHVYGALFAAGVAWALHAGVDWDWELPAVTTWLWAFGGMALAPRALPAAPAARRPTVRLAFAVGCLALAVTPGLMALSQARLNSAVAAFGRGDCGSAIADALGSLKAMPSRPQPFEVLGYCDARLGQDRLAIDAFRSGIDRDPRNWELYYGLALTRAIAGVDPRSAAHMALRLNPLGDLPRDAVRRFDTKSPHKWRRRAQRARLPIR
jgi:hypothetical protein